MRPFDFEINTWQSLKLSGEAVWVTGRSQNAFQNWYTVLRVIDGVQYEEDMGEEQFADSDSSPVAVAANSNVIPFGRYAQASRAVH